MLIIVVGWCWLRFWCRMVLCLCWFMLFWVFVVFVWGLGCLDNEVLGACILVGVCDL